MRMAALAKSLDNISEKSATWPSKILNFKYADVTGIGSGEAIFESPLTIITGQNSSGKTTLLRSIWFALDPSSASAEPLTERKVRDGIVEVTFRVNGNVKTTRIEVDHSIEYPPQERDYDIIHIDSAGAITDLQKKIFLLGEAMDIINGAPDRIINPDELAEVNYLTRREFSEVRVFEVEIEAGLIAPFFEVVYRGSRYDSTQAGSGEYAVMFLWWTLWNAKKGSLLLIEEPETFLSASNQESMLNYLITIANKKRFCIMMTSHSGHLLHFLPPDWVKFLKRRGDDSQIDVAPHPKSLESIGIYLRPDVFVYVEDKVAQLVGKLILERFDPTLARRCKFCIAGGEAVISKSLGEMANNPFLLRFVGWYDGDQKGKVPDSVTKFSATLPGEQSIETIFRQLATTKPEDVGLALGVEGVADMLYSLEGDDPHDWLFNLSREMGRDPTTVLTIIFNIWVQDLDILAEVEASFQQFRSVANS